MPMYLMTSLFSKPFCRVWYLIRINLVRKCEKVKKQLNYAFGPKGKKKELSPLTLCTSSLVLLIERNTIVVWGYVSSDFIVDIGYTRNTKSIDYNNMLHIFQFKWLFSSRREIPWYEETLKVIIYNTILL